MTSEITTKPTLAEKQWIACRDRVRAKLASISEFHRVTLREMLPDIRAIKEKKLWKFGEYASFEEFCLKALSVTRQRIYQLMVEDDEIRATLEFVPNTLNNLTFQGSEQPPSEPPPESSNATTVEPPAKPKKRQRKPEPEPVDAEPVTPAANALATTAPTASTISNGELPLAAKERETTLADGSRVTFAEGAWEELGAHLAKAAKFCPHCGKEIE